ncbi:MAG: pilus assembly protein [Parvularculaceae bacterium]|jgi:Flp pilus assembly protein TadG|nr:pilus assembly protein [Parvularculaceae bacterium]
MRQIRTLCHRLVRALADRTGLAATEFALLLPPMLLIFFGMLEGSDLLTMNRRLAHTANTVADLAARERTITHAQVTDLLAGARRLLEPTDTSTLNITIVSVIVAGTPARPTVHWSRNISGGTPYAAGSPYNGLDNNASLNPAMSFIVVEVDYVYDSGLTSRVFHRPYSIEYESKRTPRKSTRVQLCTDATPAVCTT